jgi:membrane-associated phospholipid phosphatase
MSEVEIEPTGLDLAVADAIAKRATPAIEGPLQFLTCAGDERILLAAAGVVWLASWWGNATQRRRASHLGVTVILSSIVPHVMKHLFWQKRPDRYITDRARSGIPKSGNPNDAFPSGHAVQMGAIASASSLLLPSAAPIVCVITGVLSATRVVLEAHWASDVVVGMATGVLIERSVRPLSFGAYSGGRGR